MFCNRRLHTSKPFGLAQLAIERLHLDPARSRQLGLAARERTIAEFDERIVIEKTLGVGGVSWFVVASAARQSSGHGLPRFARSDELIGVRPPKVFSNCLAAFKHWLE